jgi:serralysin
MNKRILLCLVLTTGLATSSVAAADPPPLEAPKGELIFADEFDRLDLQRYDTKFFWGARWLKPPVGEKQVYTDPSYTGTGAYPLGLNPFSVEDGILHIKAERPRSTVVPYLQGQTYTSGLLTTFHSFSALYGYFEIRAKLPAGKGFHPTFWLLQRELLPQPPSEIDICETIGDRLTTSDMTIHWADAHNRPRAEGGHLTVPDLSKDFHRFGVYWTAEWIAWYFDGQRVYYVQTPFRMHKPMHLLLNLAVGGTWEGSPNQSTRFPADFAVDYIRAYNVEPSKASSTQR